MPMYYEKSSHDNEGHRDQGKKMKDRKVSTSDNKITVGLHPGQGGKSTNTPGKMPGESTSVSRASNHVTPGLHPGQGGHSKNKAGKMPGHKSY